ncbi:MAG: cell division protein FtsL [Clostridia bacterium]|nr:cell division protein FtsL [Clostridia bacterium]
MVYRGTEAYDFSLFEPQVIEEPKKQNKTSRQPKRNNAPVRKAAAKKTEVTKVINDLQYVAQRDAKNVAIPTTVKKIMCFCALCVSLMVVLLVMQTKNDNLMTEISTVQSEIKIAQGENVRLNAELNSMIASDRIEEYAENELGMVKAESYQINYIDLSEGDEIVVSGEKTLGEKEENKLKTLFAYIF